MLKLCEAAWKWFPTKQNVEEIAGDTLDKEVQEVLLTDRYAAEVRRDEMEARANNVHGVPFFVINDKYAIPGALSVEQMENVLKKLLAYCGK